MRIRVFPNVAQCSTEYTNDLKKFFIRPEDLENYEPYVDVYEFYGDSNKLLTYYQIYKYDKKWFGPLKDLIIGFNDEIDNKYIIPRFPERRIKCGKKCLKGVSCSMCETIEQLSKTLEDAKMIIQIDKDKNNDIIKNEGED